eukprot:scaffold77899_cov36-Phaeocystis_antarctica.AAC.1
MDISQMDLSQIEMPQIETSHLAATETWFAGAPTISEALPPGLPASRLSAFPRLAEEDSLNLGLPSPRGTPAGARRKALKANKGVAAKGAAMGDVGGAVGGDSPLTVAILEGRALALALLKGDAGAAAAKVDAGGDAGGDAVGGDAGEVSRRLTAAILGCRQDSNPNPN